MCRRQQWCVKIIAVIDICKLFVNVSFETDDQTTQTPNGSICKVVTAVDRTSFSHLISDIYNRCSIHKVWYFAVDFFLCSILCLWFRATLIYINNCPTRCNTIQSIYYSASSLYTFRVSTTPIIRSTQNCNYSLRYCSYLTPTWLS